MKAFFYTLLALLAFAGNSVLCRLALKNGAIDPVSFTIIRLFSGALILYLLVIVSKLGATTASHQYKQSGGWLAAFYLFIYAASFSFAYVQLNTGVGALLLFGVVQITIVVVSVYLGDRLSLMQYLGLLVACLGFFYLVQPSLLDSDNENSIQGIVMMSVSGLAWGAYTLLGRTSNNPLQDTAVNFVKSLPFVLALSALYLFQSAIHTWNGVSLALISGMLTSALGYAVWYLALRYISRIQAAVVQLLVPVIAALGGVLLLSEPITLRLVLALLLILGGVFVVSYASSQRS